MIATRALFSTLGHVVFSACWAYPLGWRKQKFLEGRPASRWPVALGLAGAAALHGLFDFYLMKAAPEEWKTLVVFAAGLVLFLHLLRRASGLSPFRELNVTASRTCPRCNGVNRSGARFCVACGSGLDGVRIKCGHCGATARPEANFCASCGFRFTVT